MRRIIAGTGLVFDGVCIGIGLATGVFMGCTDSVGQTALDRKVSDALATGGWMYT